MVESTVGIDRAERLASELAAGAVAGMIAGVAAGVVARIAMRAFAVGVGHTPAFTSAGTAAILTTGLLLGAAFGMVYVGVRRVVPGPEPVRGLVYAILVILLVEFPVIVGGTEESSPDPMLGFALFVPVSLVFGATIGLVLPWFERRFLRAGGAMARPLGALAIAAGALGLLVVAAPILQSYGRFLAGAMR